MNAPDPDLVLEREFDAPRELVFRMWTDPAHLAQWWGPAGFTNPVCEFDARPGGAILIHMTAPDGTVYPMPGTVEEIDPPAWLAFTASALDGELQDHTTVSFSEAGGKTTVRIEVRVTRATEAARAALAGMEQGWSESLDRLAALVGRAA